jgi:hypothetical protein
MDLIENRDLKRNRGDRILGLPEFGEFNNALSGQQAAAPNARARRNDEIQKC